MLRLRGEALASRAFRSGRLPARMRLDQYAYDAIGGVLARRVVEPLSDGVLVGSFALNKSYSEITALTRRGLRREEFIAAVLAAMRDAGFDRVRYYEVTTDVAISERVAILVQEADHTVSHAGFKILLRESTLVTAQAEPGIPVIGRAYGDNRDAGWVEPLELDGRAWVEIPVTAGAEMKGLIACDWVRGRGLRLSHEDCELLGAIGALTGSYLGLKPIALLENYRGAREKWPVNDPVALVRQALPHLAEVVDSAVAAVFEFDWTDQSLTKIDEHVAPGLLDRARKLGKLSEHYTAGDCLTGGAWTRDSLHHIVSFDSILSREPQRVAPESYSWHCELLGEVRSVVYAVLGGMERRFLLRFINRAMRPEIPFVYARDALDTVVSELRTDVDRAVTEQRSEALQTMARLAAEATTLETLLNDLGRRMSAEAVTNYAVVCHQHQLAQFKLIAFSGPRMGHVDVDPDLAWRNDPLYARARAFMAPRVDRLGETALGSLSRSLRERGFRSALTIPMESGATHGVLIVPMDHLARESAARTGAGYGYGTTSMLLSYARLIVNAIESGDARARVDSAIRALGLMGHELRGPIARLEQAAEEVLGFGMNVARDLKSVDEERSHELQAELTARESVVSDALRAVDVTLELAPFVVNDSNRLELMFRAVNLLELLEQATEDVRVELHEEGNYRAYMFDYRPSARRLDGVQGSGPADAQLFADEDHVRQAFKNILRNAVKYSLPRHAGEPMVVEIIGEPQEEFVAIKVRNWGHGIPPSRRHLIFDPWVRGEVNDKLKAIGGMGLGLHLAKHIVAAHHGEIKETSTPTLDDPVRTKELEGFETMFEVRISRKLKEGKHIYYQDGRLEGPSVGEYGNR